MNFAEMDVDARFGVSHGTYRSVDAANLPPLFLSYWDAGAEPSDRFHQTLRQRFDAGDGMVRTLLSELAALVVEGEAALRWGDQDRFAGLLGENMRLRRGLAPIPEAQLALVDIADSCDAPVTFTGSGGAIVGAVTDDGHFARVAAALNVAGATAIRLD